MGMKWWQIALLVLGGILLFDGGIRLALSGLPGLSGIILATPCFYFALRKRRE